MGNWMDIANWVHAGCACQHPDAHLCLLARCSNVEVDEKCECVCHKEDGEEAELELQPISRGVLSCQVQRHARVRSASWIGGSLAPLPAGGHFDRWAKLQAWRRRPTSA